MVKSEVSTRAILEGVAAAARGERRVPLQALTNGGLAASRPVQTAARQLVQLTPRERQVLSCIAAGHDNLKIGALLGIAERTVKAHVAALYRKLGAENRVQLALVARKAAVGTPEFEH